MASPPIFDWHLKEWMNSLGKRQADFTNELGWSKAKANAVWHGDQRYNRDIINEVSSWLQLRPYELLMAPDEAMAIRRMRESAATMVASEVPARPVEVVQDSGRKRA
jgi:hypothetical protein